MRELPQHGIPGHALAPALPTPPVRLHNATLDDSTIWRQMLPDSFEAELVESAERGQAGRSEGSVEHVEVFRMDSVGTSILRETSTPTTPSTTSDDYTLKRQEPDKMTEAGNRPGTRGVPGLFLSAVLTFSVRNVSSSGHRGAEGSSFCRGEHVGRDARKIMHGSADRCSLRGREITCFAVRGL